MNSNLIRKTVFVTIISQLCLIYQTSALEVSLNDSENLSIDDSITYVYQNVPRTLSFQINDPIVCTSIAASNPENLIAAINDANNLPISTLNHNILSTQYNPANAKVDIITDNSIACATQNGLLSNDFFNNGFEEADLQLSIFDGSGMPFPANITLNDQDVLNYQYVINNNANDSILTDLGEYYRLDNTNPFFSGVVGNDWTCNTANTGAQSTTSCGNLISGDGFVRLKNATVDPGEQLIVSVSRTVEIPNGSIATAIELLGAAFSLIHSDINTDNNVIFQVFNL